MLSFTHLFIHLRFLGDFKLDLKYPNVILNNCAQDFRNITACKVYWYNIQSTKRKKKLRFFFFFSISTGYPAPSTFLLGWDKAGQVDHNCPDPCLTLTSTYCSSASTSPAHDINFNRWYLEVNHFCKEVPVIIVGCKTDLYKNKSQETKPQKNGLQPATPPRSQEMVKAMGVVVTSSARPNSAKSPRCLPESGQGGPQEP